MLPSYSSLLYMHSQRMPCKHAIMVGILSLLFQPLKITSCASISGYTLSVVNNISQQVGFGTEGTALSIIISNVSTYYNITIYANTNCGTITTSNSSLSELKLSLQCSAVD